MTDVVQIIIIEGEAWGPLDGASICTVTEQQYDDLCQGLVKPRHIKPLSEVVLTVLQQEKEDEA